MFSFMPETSDRLAPHIALIGGGTGSFTLLQELKHFTPNIAAIINMSDDGGSSGKMRNELGAMPPGDIRQCLVALSNVDELTDIFKHRFDENSGSFSKESLGNIILAGLEQKHGSFGKAVKVASALLQITGRVIPVTLENHTLVMQDGTETIRGEYIIGHRSIAQPDAWISLDPPAPLNPEAADALETADLIAIAPGNLYGSLLPALAVDGMAEALQAATAPKVMVGNLVNKPGQTDGWHVVDYARAMERYIGQNQIDVVLYNQELPSEDLLRHHAAPGELPVEIDGDRFGELTARAIGANLVANTVYKSHQNDSLRRTSIRHDACRVGQELMRLL